MNDQRNSQTPPTIPGSWDDLYQKGQSLAAEQPEEAIALFYRVFNGLGRLPESRRALGDGRLQRIYERSALSLNASLNLENRYDEALEVLGQASDHVAEDGRMFWRNMTVAVMLVANRLDEAHAQIRQYRDSGQLQGVDAWQPLVISYIRAGRGQDASSAIDEIQQWVDDKYAPNTGDISESKSEAKERITAVAGVHWMRGRLATASQEWAEALEWFDKVIAIEGPLFKQLHHSYSEFIAFERYQEADTLIKRDGVFPIRSGFWSGLMDAARGHNDSAIANWHRVSKIDVNEEPMSLAEYSMAAFHIGDPDGSALDRLMNLMQERPTSPWQFYYLAGIGLAAKGEMTAAHSHLSVALRLSKSMVLGTQLPYENWLMARDMFDDEKQAELGVYFKPAPKPLVNVE